MDGCADAAEQRRGPQVGGSAAAPGRGIGSWPPTHEGRRPTQNERPDSVISPGPWSESSRMHGDKIDELGACKRFSAYMLLHTGLR